MSRSNSKVAVFINHLYYGAIKWPNTKTEHGEPVHLTIKLKGEDGFLGRCVPERIKGYGSTKQADGPMYVMSLGIKGEYSLIDSVVADSQGRNLEINFRREPK